MVNNFKKIQFSSITNEYVLICDLTDNIYKKKINLFLTELIFFVLINFKVKFIIWQQY